MIVTRTCYEFDQEDMLSLKLSLNDICYVVKHEFFYAVILDSTVFAENCPLLSGKVAKESHSLTKFIRSSAESVQTQYFANHQNIGLHTFHR